MAAKSSYYANALLKLIFNGTPFPYVADNAGTSPMTDWTIALHTASPSPGGTQSTSEAMYSGYARQTVTRDAPGWTVSGTTVSPVTAITFPTATGGAETETHWSIGFGSGAGNQILMYGPINPTIAVVTGVTPQLTTASSATET